MEPLRLTWTLAAPLVASPHPLHLDGLLAYAQTEETLAGLSIDDRDPRALREVATAPLPLGREERDGLWCWQASVLRPRDGVLGQSMRYWTRKTDSEDFARRVGNGQIDLRVSVPLTPYERVIDVQRDELKQLYKFFPIRDVPAVEAWCIGDKDRIEELLAVESGYVTHLGGKARMGFGKVRSFAIERDPEASSRWQRRATPWPQAGAAIAELAVRPPYWAPESRQLAWIAPELLT
jgi:CRISPR type IV-associated protein Csf3